MFIPHPPQPDFCHADEITVSCLSQFVSSEHERSKFAIILARSLTNLAIRSIKQGLVIGPISNRKFGQMSASAAIAKDQQQAAMLLARMERLHICSWHVKAGVAMGLATFFDAYGTLSIGYVLPVLASLWHLTPQNIGFLISASFVGQIAGGIFFGWLAERIGRVRSA